MGLFVYYHLDYFEASMISSILRYLTKTSTSTKTNRLAISKNYFLDMRVSYLTAKIVFSTGAICRSAVLDMLRVQFTPIVPR